MTLVEFVEARIADDEAAAGQAIGFVFADAGDADQAVRLRACRWAYSGGSGM